VSASFKQGERVIVPLHGSGVVQSVEKLSLPGGGKESCYVVALEGRRGGRVVIPKSGVKEYGLRRPMSSKQAKTATSILAESFSEEAEAEEPSQTDFYKELKDELRQGNVASLVRVVRRLYLFSLTKAITDLQLKELERYAWGQLVDELAEAEGSSKATTQRNIRSTLKSATPQALLR
jgi:RNA polymerase-interacting CarD/CdnL/TRCF family regulator